MRRIELPSEELADELHRHLRDRRFPIATYDRARKTIHFPDSLSSSDWSNVRGAIEKWAKGKGLDVSESLRLQYPHNDSGNKKPEATKEKTESKKEAEEEVKKRLESLTPQKAEERYNYLSSKPISELSDAEYEERLTLAERLSDKLKAAKK